VDTTRHLAPVEPARGGVLLAAADDVPAVPPRLRPTRGERHLGARLDKLSEHGIAVLHDRRIAGTRTNIDHVVVAPSGVWVIAARTEQGEIAARDVGGWFSRDSRLFVGGRDRSDVLESMQPLVAAARDPLADAHPDVGIRPVACFVAGDFGLFGQPFELDDVLVTSPRLLARTLQESGPLGPTEIGQITRRLAARLRVA
jgi:hypothetical protein